MNRLQLIRLDARGVVAVAAVLLLTVAAVAGPTLVFAKDEGGHAADAADLDARVSLNEASDAVDADNDVDTVDAVDAEDAVVAADADVAGGTGDTDDAGGTGDTNDAGGTGDTDDAGGTGNTNDAVGADDANDGDAVDADATVGTDDAGEAVDGAKSREELLEEWNALNQERQRLLEELRIVHRDMQAVAGELWDYELEEARQRIREQLNEYGGDYGEEIVEWLPPRLIDQMAEFTGRTPDELRDMVREGAWGDLF